MEREGSRRHFDGAKGCSQASLMAGKGPGKGPRGHGR